MQNYTYIFFFLAIQKIEKPFLSAVETTLGDRYTTNIENIYKVTIKFIIETLVTGFENSANSNGASGGAGGSGAGGGGAGSSGIQGNNKTIDNNENPTSNCKS